MLVSFCACLSGGGGSVEDSVESPQSGSSAELSADGCTSLIPGPPIGLACVHCSHPNAHEQAMLLARLMRETCRQALTTNVLIDGRFGIQDDFLVQLLSYLSGSRRAVIYLYLSNGVSQRRLDPFNPNVFGTGTSVESFRSKMIDDAGYRAAYQQVVQRALDIKRALPATAEVVLIPALEDNFSDSQFRNVLALTQQIGGNEVAYGRSPCPGCVDGNGDEIPAGVIEERHTASANFSFGGGTVTNDGFPYVAEAGSGVPGLTLDDLLPLKNQAAALNNSFVLWNAAFQGLPVEGAVVSGRPDPDARVYASPSPAEFSQLVEFLR